MSKSKMPQIRFKGFSGEWEEKEIIDIAPLQRGFDLPKSEMKIGNYPVVMSNGINNFHSEFKVEPPGIVTGRSGTIGVLHYVTTHYWPHNTTLWVTNFKGNIPLYIYYMYTKFNLNNFATGSGVPTLNRNDVHDKIILIPKSTEQTKIGNYFQHLDKLIEKKEKKLQKLRQLKKAMLDKMFPKDGATTPQIRFNGFSGEWEEKKLDEIVNRYDNLRIPISATNRIAGNIPYYGANGIQDYVKGYTHNGEFILIAEDGANDLKNYPIQYVNGKIWVNNHAHVLQAKIYIADNSFLKYAISKINIEPFLVGGGRAKLNANIMMNINCNIPKLLEEQTKIGNYFKNLDKLIDLQLKELEKFRNIKKASLDKMFV